MAIAGRIEICEARCKGCAFCVQFCPRNLIRLDSNINRRGYHPAIFNGSEDCTGCGVCSLVCPDQAIIVYRKSKK